jgi:hypothetical protein
MKPVFILSVIFLLLAGCERPTEVNNIEDEFPPAVPQGLFIYYASDGEIAIEWASDSYIRVSGYNIYRSTNDSDFVLIHYTGRSYFIDYSLDYDSLYFYRISALNYSGMESAKTGSVSARPINRFAPRVPERVRINARNWPGSRSIYLSWTPNEETDLAGYMIYRSETSEFEPDSSNFFAYTDTTIFDDISVSELYKKYYYRIKAVDKGGLESPSSAERNDLLLSEPELIYPSMNSQASNFSEFIFLSAGSPATYKLIVQTSQFFGEVWQTDIEVPQIYDSVRVDVPRGVFHYNTDYYWRVAAYTVSDQPNSITPLNKFIIVR